jgi:hypothetical protein
MKEVTERQDAVAASDLQPGVGVSPIGSRAAVRHGGYATFWKVWLPIPILFLLLDCTFNLYFWSIPRITGDADWGYQFLIDAHKLAEPKPQGAIRVLAFGSSVSGSFDPYQVQSLLAAADPTTSIEVRRLLKPGIKPSDYRLFFTAEGGRVRPDIAVILFNLLDFFNPSFEHGFREAAREALPPWTVLRERYASIPTVAEKLDLGLSAVSNLYRYRELIRSCVHGHLAIAVRWLRSRPPKGAYGWYADGYTRQRFGIPVGTARSLNLEYYVDPAWIEQRGHVAIDFSMDGHEVARRVETEAGWRRFTLSVPASPERVLQVATDSVWNPRAAGRSDDVRLLGLRFRHTPPSNLLDGSAPPFRYPPFDEGQIYPFLRMGRDTGEKFAERWQEALRSQTAFGARFRAYQQAKLHICDETFDGTGEYAEMERLVADLSLHGVFVVLVNTPESPWLLDDYQDSPYYRAYIEFFRKLAEMHPNVRFYDLRNALPPEDFNDWHHVNYIGDIKLGPRYAYFVRQAIADLKQQTARNN